LGCRLCLQTPHITHQVGSKHVGPPGLSHV
jgi:hypothetical protein